MLVTTEKLRTAGFDVRVFSQKELARFLGDSEAQRYEIAAINKGELVKIKHDMYMLSPKYATVKLSEYSIANKLVNNSYVSFESALSYHQWIPERVTITASAVIDNKSGTIKTPLGLFEYQTISVNPFEFFTGVIREKVNGKHFLMASPLRALADLIYERKWRWLGIDFLNDSLRIDDEELEALESVDFDEIIATYRAKWVKVFLYQLRQALGK
jgi:hypothetical protein